MEGTDVEGERGRRLGEVVASSTAGSNRRDERVAPGEKGHGRRQLKGRGAAGRGVLPGELDAGGRGSRKKELAVRSRGQQEGCAKGEELRGASAAHLASPSQTRPTYLPEAPTPSCLGAAPPFPPS